MNEDNLSENYRLRKYFLKNNKVPTQSLIKNKMSEPLAAIYFKSMTPKLKVIVGLEPPMKGGGADWYVPPKDLLEGRSVLKPLKKESLSKLNYLGIDAIGMKMIEQRIKQMENEKNKIVEESDIKWKAIVELECQNYKKHSSEEAAKKNTERISHAFDEFVHLYTASLTAIETVLFDAARSEIINMRYQAFDAMQEKYNISIKQQATELYKKYEDKLQMEILRLKTEFLETLSIKSAQTKETIHDINLEKHIAIGKMRKYMECQSLACQVYVALKEREECRKEMDLLKHVHQKKIKILDADILSKDYQLFRQEQNKKKRQEFDVIWQKKVWHIVQKFQMFVSYCLKTLPDHADFFINMEKLMLLHLNEVLENPSTESIFEVDNEIYEGPRPNPHPFFLFCDLGHKYEKSLEKDLCPKRCTSSASHMPVILINKRCMYAACDNFEQFTNKVKHYIYGKRGDDIDFVDNTVYEHLVPVKYTSSQQLLEVKLESSLLQILQQELPNIRDVPIECSICKIPYCFCSPTSPRKAFDTHENILTQQSVSPTISLSLADNKIKTRSVELNHEREPKWESYFKYVKPQKCKCSKTSKKHLMEHLPAYMRRSSVYDTPELPHYEQCSLHTLKNMVRKARGNLTPPSPIVIESEPKTKDMAIQCTDSEYQILCECMSADELRRFMINQTKVSHISRTDERFQILDCYVSPSMLHESKRDASAREQSLISLSDDSPELKQIFKRSGKSFN